MSRLALPTTNRGYFTASLTEEAPRLGFTFFITLKKITFDADPIAAVGNHSTQANNRMYFDCSYTRTLRWTWDSGTNTVIETPDEGLKLNKWMGCGIIVRSATDYTFFTCDEDGGTWSQNGTAALGDWTSGDTTNISYLSLFSNLLTTTQPTGNTSITEDCAIGDSGLYNRAITATEMAHLQGFGALSDVPGLIDHRLPDESDGTDLDDQTGNNATLSTVLMTGETVYPLYDTDHPPMDAPLPSTPILTNLAATPDYTTIDGSCTTNTESGTVYVAFFTDAGDKTHAVIKAGTGATDFDSVAVTGATVTLPQLSVPIGTEGYLWATQELADTTESTPIYIATSTLFPTVTINDLTNVVGGTLWADKTAVQYLVIDGTTASNCTIQDSADDGVVDSGADITLNVPATYDTGDKVIVVGFKPAVSTLKADDTEYFVSFPTVVGPTP